MCRCASRLIRKAALRLTSSTVSQSATLIVNISPLRSTPALLTSTTGGPSSSATRCTAAPADCSSLTSAATASARRPWLVTASIALAASIAPSLITLHCGSSEPITT